MNEVGDWFSKNPCEAWHSTYPVGTKEWSEQITRHRYFVQSHIPGFAQFERWKGKRVLEIGCGIGTDTLEFAKAGAIVRSIDISPSSAKIASDRLTVEHCHDNTAIMIWDAEIPLPPFWDSYSLVWSFGVIHHASHPECILQNALRVLNRDGELRIMLYAKYSLKHLLGTQPEAAHGCPLVKWYSAREARKLLESCGFRVVSIEKTHIFPWRIKDYREHRFVKAFPWNICPPWLFRQLEHILGHHLLIVAVKA
jgi:SAM-dependent methyltransferase